MSYPIPYPHYGGFITQKIVNKFFAKLGIDLSVSGKGDYQKKICGNNQAAYRRKNYTFSARAVHEQCICNVKIGDKVSFWHYNYRKHGKVSRVLGDSVLVDVDCEHVKERVKIERLRKEA